MVSAGIGVDMLEIERMERALTRRPSIAWWAFTDAEREYCESTTRPAAHYAARFAARRAVLRALGTGISEGAWIRDVAVERDENGRPRVALSGRAAEVADAQGVREVALSISLTHEVAVANAVAVTDEVKPQIPEKTDPAEELRETFRRARNVLDELEQYQANPTKE